VFHFHQNTLKALKELVEAAGLQHPADIGTQHIVRRVNANDVRVLADLLPQLEPGVLLGPAEAVAGLHPQFQRFWPQASAHRFGLN
jgi:hypothetical protein